MRAPFLVLASMLGACAATAVPAPKAKVAESSEAQIIYEIEGSKARSPLPLVWGTVEGRRTILIVDTGAKVPVLSGWLVRQLGLHAGGGEQTHDPAGQSVSLQHVDDVAITIDGWGSTPPRRVAVVDFAEGLRSIGGLVAPQALVAGGEDVVLDLENDTMRRAPAGRTGEELSRTPGRAMLRGAHICEPPNDPWRPRVLVADVAIDGVETPLELDTGADGMDVVAESASGKAIAARPDLVREDALAAGGAFAILTAPNVPVKLGAATVNTSISVAPGMRDRRCRLDGRLSIHELKRCVLVIGATTLQVSCRS